MWTVETLKVPEIKDEQLIGYQQRSLQAMHMAMHLEHGEQTCTDEHP